MRPDKAELLKLFNLKEKSDIEELYKQAYKIKSGSWQSCVLPGNY